MQDKKTVIITGLYGPYLGELDNQLGDDVEIWSCNMGYTIQRNISRVYVFDQPEHWLPNKDKLKAFVDDLNELDVPVYMQEKHDLIPKSVAFPAEALIEHYGFAYATSTLTWQLAHAIYERVERIVLHKIHCIPDSAEYFPQKSGLDFWVGIALGRGIEVVISDDSHIGRPHPWHSPLYGYEQKVDGDVMCTALAVVVKQVMEIAPKWENTTDLSKELIALHDGLKNSGQMRYYKPKDKPREDCVMKTRLTEADKRAQQNHARQIRHAQEWTRKNNERQATEVAAKESGNGTD